MEYSKLPPQPPAYSEQPEWNAALPSAPPTELHHVAPQYVVHQQPPVVVSNTTVVVDSGNGMVCPECNARVRMRVEHHATGKTYCLAFFLCLFLCWPCVCMPCCCKCCYKTSQFCPNCNACLGSF